MILTPKQKEKFIAYCRFRAEFCRGEADAIDKANYTDIIDITLREHKADNERLRGAFWAFIASELEKE